MMKLDIGGGFARLVCLQGTENADEYTVVDAYNINQPNTIHAPAWDIPLATASVDAIYSSHMLEHLPLNLCVPALAEWNRVLKPDGLFRLYLPDLEYCVRTWLNAPEEHPEKWGWFIKIIFGGQEYEGDAHLTGFTKARLLNLLRYASFIVKESDITSCWCPVHNQMELRAEFHKRI